MDLVTLLTDPNENVNDSSSTAKLWKPLTSQEKQMVNIKFGSLYILPQKKFLAFLKHLPCNHLIYAGRKEVENGYQHQYQR